MTDRETCFEGIDDSPPLQGLIGISPAMRRVFQLTRLSAASDAPVLLQGETGTGKQRIARALHQLSSRSGGPYVRVNCREVPADRLENELYGHERVSGVSDDRDPTGRLQSAQGGTLFLDEINATSLSMQARLLRILEERQSERVGDSQARGVDFRLIASSHCDLSREVTEGRFREDLYWRLNVLPIHLAPLRRRPEDVEPLVGHFLKAYSEANEKSVARIQPAAMAALCAYPFPGNIRELQNYIERAVVLAGGDELTTALLPIAVKGDSQDAQTAVFRPTDDEALIREYVYSLLSRAGEDAVDLYDRVVQPVEKELMIQILDGCNHTQTKAAKRLGINRNTLYKKLVAFDLAKPKSNGSESD